MSNMCYNFCDDLIKEYALIKWRKYERVSLGKLINKRWDFKICQKQKKEKYIMIYCVF